MDEIDEKSTLGCLAIVLFLVLQIVVSIIVGVFFGAGFGFIAYAAFVLFEIIVVLMSFIKAGK